MRKLPPGKVVAAPRANEVVITVANDGKQIPEHVQDHLFEPFFRATSSAEEQGLGLGLFISYEIAGCHGGRLEVYSDNNQTAFLFRMPVFGDTSACP